MEHKPLAENNRNVPPNSHTTRIWVADFDGSNEKLIATQRGGSISERVSGDVLLFARHSRTAGYFTVTVTVKVSSGS